jgi:hypothetical protein
VWVTSITRSSAGPIQVVSFTSQATLAPSVIAHRASTFGVPK